MLEQLHLRSFRSYQSYDLQNIGPITLFVGPNAAGKTNIIEGIQLLCSQHSFRVAHAEQLVNVQAENAFLSGVLTDEKRRFDIQLSIQKEGGKKLFELNGKHKKPADLQGLAPTIVFIPDNLNLAKSALSSRRDEIDSIGSQINANYLQIKKDYDKLIKHKNKLLKEEAERALIESFNDQIVVCGAQLSCYRYSLFQKLSTKMAHYYTQVTNGKERFHAGYCLSWDNEIPLEVALDVKDMREQLNTQLQKNLDEEIARKRVLIGPHADKIRFFINDQPTEYFASQGQQRSAVLALKLAEATVIEEMLGKKPILLLDDVMSELDEVRRRAFIDLISGSIQTFITTANIDYFDKEILSLARVEKINS